MPGVHRHGDLRFCGATTVVSGQGTVYANGKLISVNGDENTHGQGKNKPVYGALNVYINDKLIICAVGDTVHNPDNQEHPPGPANPKGHSGDVFVYGGTVGGGITT